MKDGRTHLAHKAEHQRSTWMTGSGIVGVTLQGADQGDYDDDRRRR